MVKSKHIGIFLFMMIFITLINGISANDFGYNYLDQDFNSIISGNLTTFIELTDTPSTYTGQAGLVATVNPGETALIFSAGGGGGGGDNASWNESLANTLYIAFDDINSTQLEINDGELNILESWLDNVIAAFGYIKNLATFTTDNLAEGTVNLYDNQSWNESRADLLYANINLVGDNESWNQTLGDLLYADISLLGDNESWNESRGNELYSEIKWGYNQTLSVNQGYVENLGFVTGPHTIDTGNASWNESLADLLYANIKWNYNQTIPSIIYTNQVNTSQSSWIESTFLKIVDMFTKNEIINMIAGNLTEANSYTDSQISIVNDSLNIEILERINNDTSIRNDFSAADDGNRTEIEGLINQETNERIGNDSLKANLTGGNNFIGNQDFGGGIDNGGTSIRDGEIWTQDLYAVTITGTNISTLNMNGSINPSLNNTFNIGQSNNTWQYGYFGTDVIINGESVKQWLYNQTVPANTYTDTVNVSQSSWINTIFLKITDMFTKSEISDMISGNRTEIEAQINNSWNESYADGLYADISIIGDNETWNESLANTLYLGISDQRFNETNLILSINTTTNIMNLEFYNQSEIDSLISASSNLSFNESLTDTLYYSISNPDEFIDLAQASVFNDTTLILQVNSSLWDYITTNENSWLSTYNQTYDEHIQNNNSWNETRANELYAEIKWNYNQTIPAMDYTDEVNQSQSSWINLVFLKIVDMFTKNEITDMIDGNLTEAKDYTDTQIDSVNDTTNIENLGFVTGSHTIDTGNLSWNESLGDLKYANIQWNYNQTLGVDQPYVEGLGFVTGAHTIDTGNLSWNESLGDLKYANIQWNYNQTLGVDTPYVENLGFVTGSHTVDTGNLSWNESRADLLYADISLVGDNESWNESLADTLYANINLVGDNESWNESRGDELYAEIKWGYNQTLGVDQSYVESLGFTQGAHTVIWDILFNNTFLDRFNSLFFGKDTDDLTQGSTNFYDNQSWNQSLGDLLYADISTVTDNQSWNESRGDLKYAEIQWNYNQTLGVDTPYVEGLGFVTGSHTIDTGNLSWNESRADLLYANISLVGDNESWNESRGNEIYLGISDQRYNETDSINSVNDSLNKAIQERISNDSNLQGQIDLRINISDEGNLNVNSSVWWAQISGFLPPWFLKNGNNLDFNETKLNNTIDERSLNETEADNTYLRLDTSNDPLTGNLNSTGNITADNFFGNINASFVDIALGGGSPTVDQLQEYIDNTGSSGFFIGGILSDGGAGTVDVSAGEGFIRTTNDENAELQSFKWSESLGIPVTNDTSQYVYVDHLGVVSLSQNEFLEAPNKIQIGVVNNEDGEIDHFFNLGVRLEESIAEAGRFIRRVHGISRDIRKGGLIFGQSGDVNRYVTMTEGSLWWGRTEYPITSFDTSGADTFNTYSISGEEDPAASQFPNTQYDNAGTLTTMINNRWANLFFYIEPDDHISMVYGRGQFVTQAQAEMEGVPSSSLPSRITETAILASRFTFKKSSDTSTVVSSFDTVFTAAGVTEHPTLSGLGWTTALHSGAINTFAGFDGTGSATEYLESDYFLTDGSRDGTGNFTINDNWFNGLFNWTVLTNWFSFDGATLSFNETKLNLTISKEGLRLGFNSTYNQTYDGHIQNNNSWNESGADLLYADISLVGDNESWNESRADGLYLGIADQRFNETDLVNSVNDSLNTEINERTGNDSQIRIDYTNADEGNFTILNNSINSVNDSLQTEIQNRISNDSNLQSQIDLRINISDESNLNVNSSDNWDNLNTPNLTQMENSLTELNIKESWITTLWNKIFETKTTDDLPEGDTNKYYNQSWNESRGDLKYADISTVTNNNSWNESRANQLYTNQIYVDNQDVLFNNSAATYTDSQIAEINQSVWDSDGENISYSLGNVGIGTTTPEYMLDINGSSLPLRMIRPNTGGTFIVNIGGSPNTLVSLIASSEMSLEDSTGKVVRLKGGNVGIGTTNPTHKLNVDGSANFSGTINVGNDLSLYGISPQIIWKEFNDTNIKIFETNNDAGIRMDLDIITANNTQGAEFTIFRQTNTTGTRVFRLFKGDGTTGRDFEINNGNINIVGDINSSGNIYTNGVLVNDWLYNQTLGVDTPYVEGLGFVTGAHTTGDNASWNESYANGLYADISVETNNNSWNESFADTKYAEIKWGYNQTEPAMAYTDEVNASQSTWINNVFLKIADMFTKSEITDMIDGNLTEAKDYTDTQIDSVNDTTNIENLGFVTGAHTIDTGNASWNESLADTKYDPIGNGDNSSWNQSLGDLLYADISTVTDNESWNESLGDLLYADINTNSSQWIRSGGDIYYQNLTGKVGIGTASPQTLLHIEGANEPMIIINDTTNGVVTELTSLTTAGFVGTASNHSFIVGANAMASFVVEEDLDVNFDTGTLFIDAGNDRVGIGTASPGETLVVAGDVVFGDALDTPVDFDVVSNGAAFMRISSDEDINSADTDVGIDFIIDGGQQKAFWHYDQGLDKVLFGAGTTNNIVLDDGGNVGIGVADPDAKLEVAGTTHIQGIATLDSTLVVQSDLTITAGAMAINSDTLIGQVTRRADNILVGITASGVSKAAGLQLTNLNSSANICKSGAGVFCQAGSLPNALNINNIQGPVQLASGGVIRMTILDGSGFVGIGMIPTTQLELSTNSAQKPTSEHWTITSDIRTKTNVSNVTDSLEFVRNFPSPINYNYNGRADTPIGERGVGWSAQDVEAYAPEMVSFSMKNLNMTFTNVTHEEIRVVEEQINTSEIIQVEFFNQTSNKTEYYDEQVNQTITTYRNETVQVTESIPDLEEVRGLNTYPLYVRMVETIKRLIFWNEEQDTRIETLETENQELLTNQNKIKDCIKNAVDFKASQTCVVGI